MKKAVVLLFESGESGIGGSFVCLVDLLRFFVQQGCDVHIVLWNDSPFLRVYQDLGAKVTTLNNPIYSKYSSSLIKFIYNKLTAFFLRTAPIALPYIELALQYRCYSRLKKYCVRHKVTALYLNNQPIR